MSHDPVPVLAQGSRAALAAVLSEHAVGLNAHDVELADHVSRISSLESGVVVGFPGTNGDSVDLVPGAPVASAMYPAGVRRANATSVSRSVVLGIVTVGNTPTNAVRAQADGSVTLSTAQWDAVTGGSGGLTPGATYFLDVAAGKLTTTPPSAPGTSLVSIGAALSPETFVLRILVPILQ